MVNFTNDCISKCVLMTLLCVLAIAHATIWYVHPDSALSTIQAGLNLCVDNDTVLVGSGTYYENILWPNTQGIHLMSESGPEVTIIDGDSTGSVIALTSGVDSTTMIRGFTMQHGYAEEGGGIHCSKSSPSLTNVTVRANTAHVGGGISCDNSSPNLVSTIITGNIAKPSGLWGTGYGGGVSCCNNSNPNLKDVNIIENIARPGINGALHYDSGGFGGGIYCDNSTPQLVHVNIITNTAIGFRGLQCGGTAAGGGICCKNSSPSLTDVAITGNRALHEGCHGFAGGGGIYCYNSRPNFVSVTISENSAAALVAAGVSGGGAYFTNSNSTLVDVIISDNITRSPAGYSTGAGIHCDDSNPLLQNVIITGNTAEYGSGGGMHCDNSSPSLTNVMINRNTSDQGGGVYCYNSTLNFDNENRCNIYLNFTVSVGCDLYISDCPSMNIIVDTFTVLQPDDYFAYPCDTFVFDIINCKVEQANQDLYVSPTGSDENSGLTIDDPLLTISHALIKILADSTNPLAIHLTNGVYSPAQTGERFPLNCRSYVSLLGEDEVSTILDGEQLNKILVCIDDNNFSIEDMTIQNGNAPQGAPRGGGVYCNHSSPSVKNVTISGNTADCGGGIYCEHSSPNITNVTISGNTAIEGGGIHCLWGSSASLANVIISENTAEYFGGGIDCHASSPSLTNVTISANTAGYGGGVYCIITYSHPSLLNCILWNDFPQEIYVESGSPSVTYSNIQLGWSGVGNINDDPMFESGSLSDYHLSSNSPCVDAGHPDLQYNDPEDPLNPGYALWPALGMLRNDMGAYGGPGSASWLCIEEHNHPHLPYNALQIHPNPFRHSTDIRYQITDDCSDIALEVYDITGRKIKDLTTQSSIIGHLSSATWDGTDQSNRPLASGVYFVTIKAGNHRATKKVLLIR